MAEKCQICGGKVINGRCSLCGMPYRNDEILYHLNEPREVHYKHASAKVRDLMRQYEQPGSKTVQRGGRENRNTNGNRNTGNVDRQNSRSGNISRNPAGKAGSYMADHRSALFNPGLLDTIMDWIGTNL